MTVRIDAHHHFWDPDAFHYPWMEGAALDPVRRPFTPADMAPALARNNIDGTVLIQTVSDVAETEQFLQIASDTEWVRGVVGWVDLTDPAVGDTLDRLSDTFPGQLVGIRHQVHDESDADWLLRPDVQHGLTEIAERNLSIRPARAHTRAPGRYRDRPQVPGARVRARPHREAADRDRLGRPVGHPADGPRSERERRT